MRRRWGPLAVGAALVLGMAWTARTPDAGTGWRLAFVGLHLAGFTTLVAYLRRASVTVRQLLVTAVVLRLLALPMLPTLSDDGYRYLWDGLIAAEADVSPYALRPSAPELAPWHGEVVFERMNSPDYYSVYPPASQAVFGLSAALYRPLGWRAAWWALKGVLVVAELVGVVALARWAGPTRAALYAWSPLAVVEIAGQGHTEALVIGGLGLVLGAGFWRLPWASVGATVAGLAKLYPLALLPSAWRREGRAGVVASAVLAGLLGVAVWSPDAAAHVRESLGLFFGTFDEYAAPYRIAKAALFPLVGESAGRVASVGLGVVFAAAVGLALASDDGTPRSMRHVTAVVVVGFALTATTLHPWYGLPVLFAIPLLQSQPIFWIVILSSATYLDYVMPGSGTVATVVGWGGGLGLWWMGRRRGRDSVGPGRHGVEEPLGRRL
ncbi:hypothetical protein [Rubrivirga sp.]|uniref:hypothetical protein n=1 Tax=Rubrivirga sp. TaxID=1885344 RepID=UPI003B52A881